MKVFFVDLVEILHSGEGGDVEQWLEPRNKLLVFAIGFLFVFSFYVSSLLFSVSHPYSLYLLSLKLSPYPPLSL